MTKNVFSQRFRTFLGAEMKKNVASGRLKNIFASNVVERCWPNVFSHFWSRTFDNVFRGTFPDMARIESLLNPALWRSFSSG